jgi:hypothetical protein
MNAAELEVVYEALAEMLDEIGQDKRDIFLAKLALLLTHEIGDAARARNCIEEAAMNIDM